MRLWGGWGARRRLVVVASGPQTWEALGLEPKGAANLFTPKKAICPLAHLRTPGTECACVRTRRPSCWAACELLEARAFQLIPAGEGGLVVRLSNLQQIQFIRV